jgi:predicted Zn-dependent peptidase
MHFLHIKRAVIAAIVALAATAIAAGQSAGADRVAAQASQVTEFEVNGLKVLVKRRPSSPTVAAGLFIRGGAANLTASDAGIENLTLETAIEAGSKFSRPMVRRELASAGAAIAASVGKDYSVVSLGSARGSFPRVWEIFADVVMNPAFAPEDVSRNRDLVLSQLSLAAVSPEGALQTNVDRVIYAGHPYANDVEGTAATIGKLTPDDLRAYHKRIMETSRLLLVFVGDVDPAQLRGQIAATFGKLPRGSYKPTTARPLSFAGPSVELVTRPNLPTNYVEGTFVAPSVNSRDYGAMRIAVAILQSLVYQEVRVRRQLSYAPGAEMDDLAANTANISVSTTDVNQSIRVMLDQIRLLREQRLRDEIIEEVASNFVTSYYLGQQASFAQANELARYEIIGGGWRNAYEFYNHMRNVTPDDVRAAANKYMTNIQFVVLGDTASIDRSIFLRS